MKLSSWLERAAHSGAKELTSFVVDLRREDATVRAALKYEWSQGRVDVQHQPLEAFEAADVPVGEARLVKWERVLCGMKLSGDQWHSEQSVSVNPDAPKGRENPEANCC